MRQADRDEYERRLLVQEVNVKNAEVRAAQAEARVANLQRLYDNAQRYIGRLQAQLRSTATSEAEAVFRKVGGE